MVCNRHRIVGKTSGQQVMSQLSHSHNNFANYASDSYLLYYEHVLAILRTWVGDFDSASYLSLPAYNI